MDTKNTLIRDIFPLQVVEYGTYLGMGEYGSRYKLLTNKGEQICVCDYRPKFINLINEVVALYIIDDKY